VIFSSLPIGARFTFPGFPAGIRIKLGPFSYLSRGHVLRCSPRIRVVAV